MAKNHNIEASRIFYVRMRKVTGAPPIVCIKYSDGSYYVETKDGKIYLESVNASNAWDAKTYCIDEWLKEKERKG